MRGQGSIEYFTIFAAMLVLFAALTVSNMVNPTSEAARTSRQVAQARSAADTIANAINGVYANSGNAVTTEAVSMDRRWKLQIGGTNDDWDLNVGINTPDGWKYVKENLRYSFKDQNFGELENSVSISSGTYAVIVEWSDSKEGIDDSQVENERIYLYISP